MSGASRQAQDELLRWCDKLEETNRRQLQWWGRIQEQEQQQNGSKPTQNQQSNSTEDK